MNTCPKCGHTQKNLVWNRFGNIWTAKGENTKYKIEQVKNVTWIYYEGAKSRKRTLPIVYNVYVIEGDYNSNGRGFVTLEEAKNYCINYEGQ